MGDKDERLDPVRGFSRIVLRLDEDSWREFVSEEENQVIFNGFFNAQDYCHLFLYRDPDSGLSVSLDFPHNIRTKVVCVSKTEREAVSKDNCRKILTCNEVSEDVLTFIVHVTEQVICPLHGTARSSRGVPGVADEALRFMERQKNEALVMRAQVQGLTFLPHPDGLHDDAEQRRASQVKLLHTFEGMIIEWAELVLDFLQQDSSALVLDGLKPLPSEEFHFWKNRLENLLFIQDQLMSSTAQQVVSLVQSAESVYWPMLRDVYRHVQEGVTEAQDVTLNLAPLQEKLEEVEQMEYQQLGSNMACVLEEVHQVWIRSEFYCRPCRIVVLLQEICNLLIHLSRKFLRGQEVLRGLVSDPGLVLDDVTLVIWTLQTFKEAYSQTRTQVEDQNQSCWDFPSHMVFLHLDHFLLRLQGIQDVLCVSLQLVQLDQTVLCGVCGRKWTSVVQDVYQDFLVHLTHLSDRDCDPTDPDDQSFELVLDQFRVQMRDLELRLVLVLSAALKTCSVSWSAVKVLSTFGFLLHRPLIQDQLRPHLVRLVDQVLSELDQTELLLHTQTDRRETFSRLSRSAAAGLCWTRQLRLRAQDSLRSHRTLQQLCVDPGESQLVQQRFQQIVDLLQDWRDGARADWSSQLDSDCGFILDQPLIQINQQGMLGVNHSHKLVALLRELRYVSREEDVELRPQAARLFTCRDDITQSHLSLSHMVSCYNQVLSDVLQVERPLIQDQLQDLDQALSELQRTTWGSAGVQQLVEQQLHKLLKFHSSVSEARANMDAMTRIIQGWAELHLLQRSGDSLLVGGATELREEGEELLRLTQVNRGLYGAADSSESWTRYLDHIDHKVQDGLFQLLLRSLHFLSDNMSPQGGGAALLSVSLRLQETGSVFEPSLGVGLSHLLTTVIRDVYAAASLPPRISGGRHGNYQDALQQRPELSALEQEVMLRLQQVEEEAETVRAGLDRYAHLWQSDRRGAMQEFLTYSRQLGPEELEASETTPTLRDFQREIESLHSLSRQVSHLDDVIVLHSWLQVDLRPFRDSLLSIIHDWTNMYTDHLLDSVSHSLQQVSQGVRGDGGEDESSSSGLPLAETIVLLEAAGVELPLSSCRPSCSAEPRLLV